MFKTHTTANGETMLITQMSDQHLWNTINMVVRKMKAVRSMVRKEEHADEFTSALYSGASITAEDAAEMVKDYLTALYPYLAEAYVRNLDDGIVAAINEITGRNPEKWIEG